MLCDNLEEWDGMEDGLGGGSFRREGTYVHLWLIYVEVVMYRCESWTVKKAERRRIDAFELWC